MLRPAIDDLSPSATPLRSFCCALMDASDLYLYLNQGEVFNSWKPYMPWIHFTSNIRGFYISKLRSGEELSQIIKAKLCSSKTILRLTPLDKFGRDYEKDVDKFGEDDKKDVNEFGEDHEKDVDKLG